MQIRPSSSLLCLVDSQGNVVILHGRLNRIDVAIQSRSYAKFFHQDKIGQTCLFAYDESKRMSAVYASARVCPSLSRILALCDGFLVLVDATLCLRRRAQVFAGTRDTN
jgi:hypothetical protein